MREPIVYCRPECFAYVKKKFQNDSNNDYTFYLRPWKIIVDKNLPIEYDLPYDRFIEYEESDRWWLERAGMLVPKMTFYIMDAATIKYDMGIKQIFKRLEKNYL